MYEFRDPKENFREFKGYTIVRTDPYGLWYIKTANGRPPNVLLGSYTSPHQAAKAIESYLMNKGE